MSAKIKVGQVAMFVNMLPGISRDSAYQLGAIGEVVATDDILYSVTLCMGHHSGTRYLHAHPEELEVLE